MSWGGWVGEGWGFHLGTLYIDNRVTRENENGCLYRPVYFGFRWSVSQTPLSNPGAAGGRGAARLQAAGRPGARRAAGPRGGGGARRGCGRGGGSDRGRAVAARGVPPPPVAP
jgi:hypothetical protein